MQPKVKIVATLGPSCMDERGIETLIMRGVNIFRLNFSYGTYEEHTRTIHSIRAIAGRKKMQIGIMQDICGPKIRIRGLDREIAVQAGDILCMGPIPDREIFSITYPQLLQEVRLSEKIFFADGTVETRVIDKENGTLRLEVLTPGILKEGKGVNFPDADLNLHTLTPKDIEDLKFGAEAGVDFAAISFVSDAEDIEMAREILRKHNSDAWIVAKIERKSALAHLDDIIERSDAIMVARGDLGAETGLSRVPILQKEIIKKANAAAKPVITATQMLTSMIRSPYPTRAEVSDIANAVFDGTDAVMLSDETATGDYPAEAVSVLVETILQSQESYPYYKNYIPSSREAFVRAASELSHTLPNEATVALTRSGFTLRHLCKFRPKKPIFAITTDPVLQNKTTLLWGVVKTVVIDHFTNEKELVEAFWREMKQNPVPFILVTGYLGEKISPGKSVRFIERKT